MCVGKIILVTHYNLQKKKKNSPPISIVYIGFHTLKSQYTKFWENLIHEIHSNFGIFEF